MRSRPKPSERVLAARKERNRLALRWTIAASCGIGGSMLGLWVWYLTEGLEGPRNVRGGDSPDLLSAMWRSLVHDWRWALGSATTGFFGVLLPALSYWSNRKQAATYGFAIVTFALLMFMGPNAVQLGVSFWEAFLPGFVIGLAMNFLFGFEEPPDPDNLPLNLQHKFAAVPPSPPSELDGHQDWTIQHTSSIEQVVDDQMAIAFGKGERNTERFADTVIIIFLAAVVSLILPSSLPFQFPIVFGCAGLWILYRWVTFERRKRAAFRKALAPEHPESYSETEKLTLRDDGLQLRDERQDSLFYWNNLQVFEERDGGIYLLFRSTFKVFIPARAFASASEKRQWRLRIASNFPEKIHRVAAEEIH